MALSTIIKVTPQQVPLVWELIKFAAVKSNEVAPEAFEGFCVNLLHKLLNGHTQAWLRYGEDKVAESVQLTEIVDNPLMGRRELVILGTYSFKLITEEDLLRQHNLWVKFARQVDCTHLVAYSAAPRVWSLLETAGWNMSRRQYTYSIV